MSDPHTLLVTASEAEALAVRRGISSTPEVTNTPVGPYTLVVAGGVAVVAGGVGPAAAAAAAAAALTAHPSLRLLVSAGVAGAFRDGGAPVGSVVVATEIVPADLGIETEEGYLDPTALGFATAATSCDPDRVRALLDRLRAAGLPCRAGPVLTLSTMTGTDARATALYGRHRPIAEAMEGAGVAHVATWWDRPVLELRTMSNLVGRRDRERWRMDEALDTLSRAVAAGFADGAAR